jgi:hypothetical protein
MFFAAQLGDLRGLISVAPVCCSSGWLRQKFD